MKCCPFERDSAVVNESKTLALYLILTIAANLFCEHAQKEWDCEREF